MSRVKVGKSMKRCAVKKKKTLPGREERKDGVVS